MSRREPIEFTAEIRKQLESIIRSSKPMEKQLPLLTSLEYLFEYPEFSRYDLECIKSSLFLLGDEGGWKQTLAGYLEFDPAKNNKRMICTAN